MEKFAENAKERSPNHAIDILLNVIYSANSWRLPLALTQARVLLQNNTNIVVNFNTFKEVQKRHQEGQNVLYNMSTKTEENAAPTSLFFSFLPTIMHRPSITPKMLEVKVMVLWFKNDPYYIGEKNIKIQNVEQKQKKWMYNSQKWSHSFLKKIIIKKLASTVIPKNYYHNWHDHCSPDRVLVCRIVRSYSQRHLNRTPTLLKVVFAMFSSVCSVFLLFPLFFLCFCSTFSVFFVAWFHCFPIFSFFFLFSQLYQQPTYPTYESC